MSTRIADLIEPGTIEHIKDLNEEMKRLLATYTIVALDLAKGLEINVKVVGDIDHLENLLVEKSRAAIAVNAQLSQVVAEQSRVIGNTTNTISRSLMEKERDNKVTREAYTEQEKVKSMLDMVNDTYKHQSIRLLELEDNLKKGKKELKSLGDQIAANGGKNQEQLDQYAELSKQTRLWAQEKANLTQIMKAEEKAMLAGEDSYAEMSQHLELLKKAYKNMSAELKDSDFGPDMEQTIQNLDAHLKDLAADMGEFQRNVGNYAIAGANGVVSTESLMVAMAQEATTMQDLADQTKILEDAKVMLDKNDTNYSATLEALNAKIEENKRKLSDVSDIINVEAKSVAEAEAQNKRFAEALKHIDLTSEGAKDKVKELNDKITANNQLIAEATGSNEKFADSMLGLIGVNSSFGSSLQGISNSGNFLDGVKTKTEALGKTLFGLLANPWVLAFLGIAGVAAGFKWWYDYNKGLIEASRLTSNFTGATGDAADKVTADMQALADHMGKGYEETIGAANTLVQHFGISWKEAAELMQDGIQAGADMSGNMLANIDRFAPALRDAGVSADEFMAILSETRNGIFDEQGVQNIVKAGTRLRAMTTQTEEALDSVGISAKQMQKDLTDGNISMIEAVQQVASKLKELPENSQQAGEIMKNVFGRTASEGGTLLIQSIADVNTNLDIAKDRMGKLGEVNARQLTAQRELNETLAAVFKMSGTSFEEMTTSAKTFIMEGITKMITGGVKVVNWLINLYNESIAVRYAFNGIVAGFKNIWAIGKFVVNQIIDQFKAMGTMLEGVLTCNWDKIKQGWQAGMASISTNMAEMAHSIADNTSDAINKTLKDKIDPISLKLNVDDSELNNGKPDALADNTNPLFTPKQSDKEKKAAEKAAKEELKRIQALEDSKIAIMADGHEKELALIRQTYKKKIDQITGNGETEGALRLQLARECERSVAECERKYQEELAKINLANRLASVKKGSKEEFDLKMGQLEANRRAEIREAEKTGADIDLINAKHNQERLELEQEYAENAVVVIQKRYADEQADRDNALAAELLSLQQGYAKQLEAVGSNEQKRVELKERYDAEAAAISERYAVASAKAAVDLLEETLKTENLSAEDRDRIARELAAAKIAYEKSVADATDAANERQVESDTKALEKRKANLDRWLSAASDSIGAISDLVDALYDGQIQDIEAQQEANDKAGEEEQERIARLVESNVITEEEGEARKRAAEDRTAKKKEELEKKKAEIQRKQAIFQKATDLAQAGIATALAITNALTTSPFPLGLAMAAIAGAMGAVQIATILATPIPQYAKGTKNHRGGPAIVGDGGRPEVVLYKDIAWITPDTPTLVDLPAGASVIPSMSEYEIVSERIMQPSASSPVVIPAKPYDDKAVRRGISELVTVLRRHTRVQLALSKKSDYSSFKHTNQ